MSNPAETRGQIIKLLEQAFALADELGEGNTGYPIERALDEARSQEAPEVAAPRASRSPIGLGWYSLSAAE